MSIDTDSKQQQQQQQQETLILNSYHNQDSSSSSSSSTTSTSSRSPSSNESRTPSDNEQQRHLILLRSRRKRDFIPDEKKDQNYWHSREKNNNSAKKSREKRRVNDLVLETKLSQLNNENQLLRAKLDMLSRKFGHLNEKKTGDITTTALQPQILNILDNNNTSYSENISTKITTEAAMKEEAHSDDELLLDTTDEKATLQTVDQSFSFPLKWRFKMLNMTHNE